MCKCSILLLFCVAPVFAQPAVTAIDSFLVKMDTSNVIRAGEMNEFILETIRIEAIIEKPNVALIPKKVETDVGELPFTRRSFEEELNATPEEFLNYGEEIEAGKRIKKSLANDN